MARHRQRSLQEAFKMGACAPGAAKPLGDASNRAVVPSPPKGKTAAQGEVDSPPPAAAGPRSPPSPPALPAAADALLLPGLDEDGAPEGSTRLPLSTGSTEAATFGSAFAASDSLRVTSITRSASARRFSQLRQVVQPDAAEGRRLSRMSPQERLAAHARTVPLREKRPQPKAAAPRTPQADPEAPQQAHTTGTPASTPASTPSSDEQTAAAEAQHVAAEEQRTAAKVANPAPLPAPLPVEPGSAAAAAATTSDGEGHSGSSSNSSDGKETCGQEGQQRPVAPAEGKAAEVAAAAPQAAAQPSRQARPGSRSGSAAPEAVYAGMSAEAEAAAMSDTAAPPSWLQRQGSCRNAPGMCMEYTPAVAMHNQHAAAVWRAMWLSGLQWHNACRVGHPIRQGSPWAFIPLDPNEPVLELFMFHTSVMPEHVIAGAARFQDILLGDPQLHAAALEAGVFSFGVWGMPSGAGGYSLMEGGRALAMPVSLRRAPPQTVALFLACVWHEANRAESAQHAGYTFGACGERTADERVLKYPIAELRQWVQMAVAGSKRFAEELLAALAHLSCFGVD